MDGDQLSLFPTEESQSEVIKHRELDVKASGSFSISADEFDNILRRGSLAGGSAQRIYKEISSDSSLPELVQFLKKEYGTGGLSYTFSNGKTGFVDFSVKGISVWEKPEEKAVFSWNTVAKRLRNLIAEEKYFIPKTEEQKIDIKEGDSSPWGRVQTSRKIIDGVYEISTASSQSVQKQEFTRNPELRFTRTWANGWTEKIAVIREPSGYFVWSEYDEEKGEGVPNLGPFASLEDAKQALFDLTRQNGMPPVSGVIGFQEANRMNEEWATEHNLPTTGREVIDAPTEKQFIATNHHITDDDLGTGTFSQKYTRNVAAIQLLKSLEETGRPATPAEQEVLSGYVGWGGLADVFDERNIRYQQTKDLLTESEYVSARASTLNAHYTTPVVIRAIYSALERLGFNGGKILEPAMGVGNFFGCLPESLQGSELYGVELDSITGRIAQYLYPDRDRFPVVSEPPDFLNEVRGLSFFTQSLVQKTIVAILIYRARKKE